MDSAVTVDMMESLIDDARVSVLRFGAEDSDSKLSFVHAQDLKSVLRTLGRSTPSIEPPPLHSPDLLT